MRKISYFFAALCLLPSTAMADYLLFFSGGLSAPRYEIDLPVDPIKEHPYNAYLRFGIQFNPYIEIGFEMNETMFPHKVKDGLDEYDAELEFSYTYLQLNYPISHSLNIYGMIGSAKYTRIAYQAGRTESKDDDGALGFGFEYKTEDLIGYNLEYISYFDKTSYGIDTDITAINFGIKTYF